MAGLLRSALSGRSSTAQQLSALADSYLDPSALMGATPWLPQTTLKGDSEHVESSFEGVVRGAYTRNGVIFACILTRLLVFSEARFQFQRLQGGRPGDLFGDQSLAVLERPWQGGTTGDLLARMELDVSLAGNAYIARRPGGRLVRLRPDWVDVVLGSDTAPEDGSWGLDAEVLGYVYWPGGPLQSKQPRILMPGEVAHYAPVPDPLAVHRGMSWLTPVLRELAADNAATGHKLKFFENAATPNLVVRYPESVTHDIYERFKKSQESQHRGWWNAYKTMYLGGGADVTVVGQNFQQMDFRAVQGAGETRIAAAAGVPPVIVGLSEGLQAATYSNYGQARRRFADGTVRPLWRNAAGSLEAIVPPPTGARLWFDDRDVAFLREDRKDVAEIQQAQAVTIKQLTDAGYTPESVVAAVQAEDFSLLVHTGLFSVQLQPPGTSTDPATPPTGG